MQMNAKKTEIVNGKIKPTVNNSCELSHHGFTNFGLFWYLIVA